MNPKKLLKKILNNNRNIRFADMIKLITAYGFELKRINGSHHIFVHPELKKIINLQEVDWIRYNFRVPKTEPKLREKYTREVVYFF